MVRGGTWAEPYRFKSVTLNHIFSAPKKCWGYMAEREGFEPSRGCYPSNGLANRRLKPLGHLSTGLKRKNKLIDRQFKFKRRVQSGRKEFLYPFFS